MFKIIDIDKYPDYYTSEQKTLAENAIKLLTENDNHKTKEHNEWYGYMSGVLDLVESQGIQLEYGTYGHRNEWFLADRAWAEGEDDWLMDLANDDEPDPIDEWVAFDPYEGM